MSKEYTGIDIGESSLKLAVCDGDTIRNAAAEPLPEGLMADGQPVSFDAMADFIKAAVRRMGGAAKDVAFVMPVSDSLVRRISIPAMTAKELELNLPYEFRDYIAQGKDRYAYDYAVLGTHVGADGVPESMDLLIAASMKDTIADYTEMFRRAGMRLRIALPVQAAFQNLVGGECEGACQLLHPRFCSCFHETAFLRRRRVRCHAYYRDRRHGYRPCHSGRLRRGRARGERL